MSAQLAQPPAYRLAVPRPAASLLTDEQSGQFAEALATALLATEVPAAADDPLPLDWRLTVEVTAQRGGVVPRYALADPEGRAQGSAEGPRIAVRDWAVASPDTLRQAAQQAAPRIAELLLRAEAARKSTAPAALAVNGPPRVFVPAVRGAPGDGNTLLTNHLRQGLGNNGFLVQENTEGAAFAVQGLVAVVPAGIAGKQRVEIQWVVSRRDGNELGRVLQLNEIPAGLLDRHWGDVAYAAASEASGGVRQVIQNAGGLPNAQPAGQDGPPGAAAPAAPAPAGSAAGLRMPSDPGLPQPRR